MTKFSVDNIDITEEQLKFIGRLNEVTGMTETRLETFVSFINQTKDTLIRVMCDAQNENNQRWIIESLEGLLIVEDELKTLMPKN